MMLKKIRHYIKGIRSVVLQMFALFILLFLVGIIVFRYNSSRVLQTIVSNHDSALLQSYKALNNVKQNYFDAIIIDYACYDWMVDYINQPRKYKPEENITATKALHLSIFQVIDVQKNTVYCSNTGLPDGDTLVFNDSFFKKLHKNRDLVFFLKYDTLIVEIHASTVQNSNDNSKTGIPQGYLIIGKLWDKDYINELSTITNSILNVNVFQHGKNISVKNHIVDLKDYNNKSLAYISYKPTTVFNNSILIQKGFFETYTLVICILILLICFVFFEIFIFKPLKNLQKSLNSRAIAPLVPIIMKDNEFSSIAELVLEYFGLVEWAHDEIVTMQHTKDEFKQTYEEMLAKNEKIEKQNQELEIQSDKLASAHHEIMFKNNQLEYQNNQITDGIKYASMIQNAVLTSQFNLEKTFKDHFIFFKPKEILSGDFYWFKEFYSKYYFACADCTGHGFSGAMMSMLGISFLNELTHHNNNKDITPSVILDKLRLKVVETLHQTGEIGQIRDGMDLGICMYDQKLNKLDFAGAYNVLYQLTKNTDNDFEIIEHKGDRMPVGICDNPEPFTNYSFNLNNGDIFYLLTDGYTDQFGGPNKKKFNKQNFKNLLLSVQHLNLSEQRLYLKEFLKSWIGNLEQVDDITVIGIKF